MAESEKEGRYQNQPLTTNVLSGFFIALLIKTSIHPKDIQLVLDSLENNYIHPTDDSPESIEIQKIYGNVVAKAQTLWEEKTGKKFSERDPLTEDDKVAFYGK